MTAPDLDEFGRCVRELDSEALTRFVADLYAARGFETTVISDNRFVVTKSRNGKEETRTVRVAKSCPSDLGSEHVVIITRRTDAESVGNTDVLDLRALHRMTLYAVERDRFRMLSAEYFDRDWSMDRGRAEDMKGRRGSRWVKSVSLSMGTLANPPTPLLAALLAVSLVVVLAATGWPAGSSTEPGVEQTVTPVSIPTHQQATSTDVLGPAQAAVCPAPPTGVHPASFRPIPVQAALSTGLESWEYRLSINSSVFYGPSPLEIRYKPELRHESTYRTPEGEDIVLTVDQWNGSATAQKAGRALAIEYGMAVIWGEYTFTVTYKSAQVNTSVERQAVQATSRLLLSEVGAPDGGKLGRECLDTLLLERTA